MKINNEYETYSGYTINLYAKLFKSGRKLQRNNKIFADEKIE